jgi:hypothetical protein
MRNDLKKHLRIDSGTRPEGHRFGRQSDMRPSRGAYEQLSLFPEADTVTRKLSQEFDLVARQLDQGLPQNPFVTLRDGELHLKRMDALEVPERVHRLRQTIETRLPRIRIEDLLRDVLPMPCGLVG